MPPAVIATFALVTWSLLTTPVAADLPRALRWNASLFVAALLVAAVVTAASGSLARLRHVALMLFAGSVATCAMALPESTQRRSFGAAVVDGRAQGVFSQPNELGLFAGTTVVLGLALLVAVGEARHPGLQRLAVVLGGLVALVALALSLSRGAWIGTLLALLVAGVLVAPIRRVLLGVVVAVTLGLSVLVAGNALPAQLDVIVARASLITDRDSNPYDARPAIWAEGVRQVREHPLVGGGPAGFTDASAGSSSMVVAFVRPAHAHNVILNFSAESGVPAGLALLAVTLLTAKAVVRGRARAGWSTRQRGLLSALGCFPSSSSGKGPSMPPCATPPPCCTPLQSWALPSRWDPCGFPPATRHPQRDPPASKGTPMTPTAANRRETRAGAVLLADAVRHRLVPFVAITLGVAGTVALLVVAAPSRYDAVSVVGFAPGPEGPATRTWSGWPRPRRWPPRPADAS